MSVEQVMTRDPVCCTPDTAIQEIAMLMLRNDCGEIPVVDDLGSRRLIGVVTDRDITCRAVANGRDPATTPASDVMTDSVVTVRENADVEECERKMEKHQIRRIPVVDAEGRVCGIVSQADIALKTSERNAGEVVRDVSRPSRGDGPAARA